MPARALTRLARRLTPEATRARLARLTLADAGHGFDAFGAHRDWVALALAATAPAYDGWFRVRSEGAHHIPATGPAILASNHGGVLPFDALMIWADVARRTDPPRLVRPVMDHFVSVLPGVGTFFTRAGGVGGSRGNFRALLGAGELVLVFPEGLPGILKPFRDRYRLAPWRVGHAELAIRYQAPVVPVAVVGAEEQLPRIGRLPSFGALGLPFLPVPATPFPLPVRYHLTYGEPLALHEGLPPEAADDPAVTEAAAARVKAAVEALIARGLAGRRGVFA